MQATMADHTAGAAASTILEAGQHVVTAEFKINLLRAVRSERLRCRADVLKSGRSIIVVEADVFWRIWAFQPEGRGVSTAKAALAPHPAQARAVAYTEGICVPRARLTACSPP
ncbi:hypothetical protein RALTA_A3213 [Cupriavidus taiwanensis LMG 19424]|uniref:Thioesterase domain-containing protein n=1 Tax=Cupriavidus taiwanensis (strain DSM 17343 / BCRC 17206 / CCUG 44338 / CIP 107171 / LMG 19424 / R1) TaxID=977880 RepID=B3R880_CUPTR|nr:hypothetical protein RALTA_A3213 [Cupriavidus taiwanensis LMG 19424]